jgi:hypothetical protein
MGYVDVHGRVRCDGIIRQKAVSIRRESSSCKTETESNAKWSAAAACGRSVCGACTRPLTSCCPRPNTAAQHWCRVRRRLLRASDHPESWLELVFCAATEYFSQYTHLRVTPRRRGALFSRVNLLPRIFSSGRYLCLCAQIRGHWSAGRLRTLTKKPSSQHESIRKSSTKLSHLLAQSQCNHYQDS